MVGADSDYEHEEYTECEALLNMQYADDEVRIGKDFVTHGGVIRQNLTYSKLTDGTMYIGGNFHQMPGKGNVLNNFAASGNHTVVLNGTSVQHIKFDSYPSSHFNKLILKQPRSQYVFEPDPCWTTLVEEGEGFVKGDLNSDESVDINDVVLLLQHSIFPDIYPIDYPDSVDFNKDGSVDINDVVLLLQYSMFPDIYSID